jgi:hypothetical protein
MMVSEALLKMYLKLVRFTFFVKTRRGAKIGYKTSVFISFVQTTDGTSNQNLDQLDQSFMYTRILKEIPLTIDFEHCHIAEFRTYCRE